MRRDGDPLGIDVGGTFTDAVLARRGAGLYSAKVPTRACAGRESSASRRGGTRARAGPAGPALDRFTHGTTVATNALLERTGSPDSFRRDGRVSSRLLHPGRQNRAHLYRLGPRPIRRLSVPLERCHGCGRAHSAPDGVRHASSSSSDSCPRVDAEAIAVCLLFAFREGVPRGGEAAAELRRRYPGCERRRLSRGGAGVSRVRAKRRPPSIDAYLGPVFVALPGAPWRDASVQAGLPEPLVMRSSGGVATVRRGRGAPPRSILVSGPAGGVVASEHVAAPLRDRQRDRIDMGGTSTDACPDRRRTGSSGGDGREVGGFPDPPADGRHPHGRRRRRLGRLAGRAAAPCASAPCSAGGDPPGLPATGAAASTLTVTDANLLLGRLPVRLPGGPRARLGARRREPLEAESTRKPRGRGRQRRDAEGPCVSSRSSVDTTRETSR